MPSEAFFGNSESSARIAKVFGFGFAAIATRKNGSEKACFGSGPLGSIEKYFG
jgi:hypothetical protein